MDTNSTLIQNLFAFAERNTLVEFKSNHRFSPAAKIAVAAFATALLLAACSLCFAQASILIRRQHHNQQVVEFVSGQHDDDDEHEEVAREEPRAPAPGESSDDELNSPHKTRERV